MLPKKEYFAAEVSLAALKPTASPFDDENYDEDEELEKEHEEVDKETEDTTTTLSGLLYLILDLKLLTLYIQIFQCVCVYFYCYDHCNCLFHVDIWFGLSSCIHENTIYLCPALTSVWLECFQHQIV